MAPSRLGAPATYPKAARATLSPSMRSCSGWGLPCRACCHARGALLPHLFTIAAHESSKFVRVIRSNEAARSRSLRCETAPPCDDAVRSVRSAVCFLWHFPSPHDARPLTGILLCGARTFLCVATHTQRLSSRLPGDRVARSSSPWRRPDFSYDLASLFTAIRVFAAPR